MAVNQSGIAIIVKAFLPTGKTLDETFAALSIVKAAHESGDYTALLKAAQIDEIKTEQKTRRIENHGVTVADLVNKADPLAVEPEQAPQEDPLVVKAQALGLPWKGISNEALKASIEAAEKPPFVPTECDDAPVGLAVVEDSRPLPWADEAPAEEAKPKGKKKAE